MPGLISAACRRLKWIGSTWLVCAASLVHAEASGCELRVWPSAASAASTGGLLSNLGLAGALADYERNKDGNLHDQVALIEGLTPPMQARLLSDAGLSQLFDIPDASVRFEARPLPRGAVKRSERQSPSTAPCYAELIVALNFYQKSTVYGRRLTTHFTFKDYRGGKVRRISAKAASPLRHFPPLSADQIELAQRDLMQAFTSNVAEFAAKVRSKTERP